ncbi:hypothetical protein BDW60DRAFT_210735 [Aspergillus nidulans var. acristatus]
MDQYLLERANARSDKVFRAKPTRTQLQLQIIEKVQEDSELWRFQSKARSQINQIYELEEAYPSKSSERIRIYTIQHVRSWKTLDISRELFDRLLAIHQVFPEIWRVLLTFGLRSCENEYGFPPPQVKESREKLTYVMRRVERNGKSTPGCPWSIRQTGVYQKLVQPAGRSQEALSTFFLVAPSSALESNLIRNMRGITDNVEAAFSIHKSIVAEGLAGWMDYMCWLEEQLTKKSTRVMATPGETGTRELNFVEDDRHELRQLEDYITDLRVVLQTKMQTIRRLMKDYQRCRQVIQEFEEYVNEAQMYLERAGVLQDRVQSVQNLLSDLLGYEELRTLRELMTHTVQGSTAMEQVAVIGLVFIPATLVENFFSTEFVKNDSDGLRVSGQVWIMVAVAVPMTVCVLVFWRLWLRYEFFRLRSLRLARRSLKALVKTRRPKDEDLGMKV